MSKQAEHFWIIGIKPVVEKIDEEGFFPEDEIYLARKQERLTGLLRKAEKGKVKIHRVSFKQLSEIIGQKNHQGIALLRKNKPALLSLSQEDLISYTNKPKLFLAFDGITDTGNVGALARSAVSFEASGFIIPRKKTASLSAGVWRSSAGAIGKIPVMFIPGLAGFMHRQNENLLFVGTSTQGKNPRVFFAEAKQEKRNIVLVLGSEQKGISPLVQKRCKEMLAIPTSGQVESLNVSVAGAILMYEYFTSFYG
ncbi:MAG: 23S rRNA (guanosine(2251)-2'-O)-methyltransferase RlmB [Candidatus Hydrogenedentota bacterium]|nr:MAG: 23S rRNA (guanosine(2251)-2'-O)-methyltransferase RlmB [Candidatus Hydrogenedentota bacterium]